MNIGRLLLETPIAVEWTDTIEDVLAKMTVQDWNFLPVMDEGGLAGIVRDDQLWDLEDTHTTLKDAPITLKQAYLIDTQHIYDAILFFRIHEDLPWIPVVDPTNQLVGLLTPKTLLQQLSTLMSVQEPGAIIVLEMCTRDNALSHIAQIVESNNAQILHSYVQTFEDSARLEVTIKINKLEISDIISSFLRYNYRIKETYNDEIDTNQMTSRYEHLMNFIHM
jgi:acetoin utilization protein AcuB